MIIFDLDGTLWDTISTTTKATIDILEREEIKFNFDTNIISKSMGLAFSDVAKMYFPTLEKEKREYLLNEIIKRNVEIIKSEGADIYEGVCEVIRNLSQKHKLAIITNNKDDYVKAFFKASGLEPYFSDYMGAATYEISKGEAIKRMVEKHNEPTSFYVGDIKKDMIAANEAGIGFIHAKYGFEPMLNCPQAIENISDLPKLLDNITVSKGN